MYDILLYIYILFFIYNLWSRISPMQRLHSISSIYFHFLMPPLLQLPSFHWGRVWISWRVPVSCSSPEYDALDELNEFDEFNMLSILGTTHPVIPKILLSLDSLESMILSAWWDMWSFFVPGYCKGFLNKKVTEHGELMSFPLPWSLEQCQRNVTCREVWHDWSRSKNHWE